MTPDRYEVRRDALFATIATIGNKKATAEEFDVILKRCENYLAGGLPRSY